jgi:hypothetical protein
MRGFFNISLKRAAGNPSALVLLGLTAAFAVALPGAKAAVRSSRQESNAQALTVQARFADKQSMAPDEPIELTIDRPLAAGEGRLAVLVGATDMTGLFVVSAQSLKYDIGKSFPLPLGATELTVYLVPPNNDWKEIARFPLRVGENATDGTEVAQAMIGESEAKTESQPATDASAQQGATPERPQAEPQTTRRFGFDKLDFAPQLNIGFKSQFAETHFPEANRPDRPTFADATMQGTWKTEMARGAFNMQSQFDFVGSSFRNEALRFGDLQGRAPKVDLSSYSMQFQEGTRKFTVGHSGFGAHRHLINNFSSRGVALAAPLGPHADISLMTMNGANVVGFDNFSGLANRRHRMNSAILGLEAFKSRPGGLRFEVGALDAWFTSNRQNFNQSKINDAERNRGYSARLLAKNKSERARLDGGFTRSYFYNPDDPLLNQGAAVQSSRAETRNARYVDASYDLLKEFVFKRTPSPATASAEGAQPATATQDASQPAIEPKKLNLTVNFRHERVDPLFRSVGASTQADLFRNEAEFVGSYGELNFTAAHTRFNDNLAGIRTILRTNTRRAAFTINTPLQGLFGGAAPTAPNPFLPRVGYTFERVQASADFIPNGGGFDQPGAIPDQANTVQSFTAEWQIKEIKLAYRLNHSLQDNRALGRERADLQNFTHNGTVGWSPLAKLELNFDLSFEDANNREQARTDRNLRFGATANWQATGRQTFNLTLSTAGAGDLARTARNFNNEFDLQWSYRLARENENRFKKFQANYFLRYANRFARARNFVENIDNLTKLQTFNTGLNFIFF